MAADNGVPEARRPKLPVGARRALARKASRRACPPRSVLPRTRNSACRPRNTEYAVNGSHRCPATGVRLGFGFAMFGDRFTGAPEIALGPSQAGRDYSLGWWMVDAGTGDRTGRAHARGDATRDRQRGRAAQARRRVQVDVALVRPGLPQPGAVADAPTATGAGARPDAVASGGWRARKPPNREGPVPNRDPGRPALREIAVAMFGAERVAAACHADGWMRARVRRLLCRAAGPGRGPSGS